MSRSPLSYPLSRGADLGGGGVADLQTDVMRFMAIISLCLVAIFALVQSIPASPPPMPVPERVVKEVVVPEPEPVREAPEPVAALAPAPEPLPASRAEPIPEPVSEPASEPLRQVVQSTPPVPPPAAAEPEEEGFTLRFASDTALKALVARDEVGLYAIDGDRAMRLGSDRGRLQFWQASLPKQVHEMDAATVPPDVTRALRRSGEGGDYYWGVTLTANLSRQLDRFLKEATGGELVIAADGNLRLE